MTRTPSLLLLATLFAGLVAIGASASESVPFSDGRFAIPGDITSWDVHSDRHSRGANLSFADGHTEHARWRWTKEKQMTGSPPVNSSDLQDLKWLQERLPTN